MRHSRSRHYLAVLLTAVTVFSCFTFGLGGVSAQTSGTAEAFVRIASGEVDYYEEAFGRTKYGAAFGDADLADWDCAFVAWCAGEAGVPSDVIPNYLDAKSLQSFFKTQGTYSASAAHGSSYAPQAGDIAFLSLTANVRELTSVGVVESVSETGFTLIEGNCPNRVRRNAYTMDNEAVIGFGSPAYSAIRGETASASATPNAFETGLYSLQYDMNLRVSPAMGTTILALIPQGTVIAVDKTSAEWGHTTYQGKEGWVSLSFSTLVASTETKNTIGQYRTNAVLNFRSTAVIANNNILGTIPSGTLLTVSEISGNWGKTIYNGRTGWVSLDYCTVFKPGANEPVAAQPSDKDLKVDWLVIDISRHNAVGNFNWNAIKAAGVMGVIIRVGGRGYGSAKSLYDDTAFYQHYTGAKNAGLHVGAYFFSYALNTAQAKEEAQMTINILRSCNAKLDMPVFIDIEDYAESDYVDTQHQKAGRAACSTVVNTFCDTVKNAGYYPGVYCNKNFAENLLDQSVFTSDRALWIAHYASACGYTRNTVHMWQYTGTGKVSGYSGTYLDMNRCYVNFPLLISGGGTINPQHTTPNPTPGVSETTTAKPVTPPVTEPPKPVVKREWETTQAPTCTEDGMASLFEGTRLFAKRSLSVAHSNPVNCVLRDETAIPGAGETFDLNANKDRFYSEANSFYLTKCAEVNANGGCRFQYCPDCNEILQVNFYYKSSCSHAYAEQVVSEPTCDREGVGKTVCAKCGKTGSEYVIPREEHTPGAMTYMESTQASPACYGILCSVCGRLTYASYNVLAGDVDGDMEVTAADARLTLRHTVSLEQIAEEYLLNADFNNDGSIEAEDARLILRKAVNLD